MLRLLLAYSRSVHSRPLPALSQYQIQFRRYRISAPSFSPASVRINSISPDNLTSSDASASYTTSGYLLSQEQSPSSSVPAKLPRGDTAQGSGQDQNETPTNTVPDINSRPKRAYVRRKPLLPRPPKQGPQKAPNPPGPRAHYKPWRKSTPEQKREAALLKQELKLEKLRVAAEHRAQKEAIKEQKRQYWRDKRVRKVQQETDEKARKAQAKEAVLQQIGDRKEAKRLQREAVLAEKALEEDRKKQIALLALEKAAVLEKERRERKARRKVREAEQEKHAARLSSIRSEFYPEAANDYLRWAFATPNRPGSRADKRRINLTSQSLANNVLERLRPSLDKHKGCDIVDINPGVGVWSATLHKYLKPRKHILLEPDETLYSPRLKPLLDAPDSKYTLIPRSGIVWRHLEDVLTKSNLPFQDAFKGDDPRLEQPNNTLLVVASLGFHPRRPYRGFASISQLVLHQLVESVRSHSLFQRYGLVRMLIWTGDVEALKVLPKVIGHRRKSSIEAEIACDIKEIASSTTFSLARDSILAASSTAEVLKRMKEVALDTPADRESDMVQEIKRGILQDKQNHQFSKTFLSKLASLEKDFKDRKFKKTLDGSQPAAENGKGNENGVDLTPEYSLLQLYRRQYQSGQVISAPLQKLVDENVAIMGLQRMHYLSTDEAQREQLMNEITSRGQSLKDQEEDCSDNSLDKLISLTDNAQAVAMNPPLLAWDRREAEPLKVHPEEFYPEQEMTLLDIQPKAIWPILRENYPENWETFEFLISQLMVVSRQPLKRGLESLAPGAFQWLVEQCPLLTDPTKGGCFDPSEIRVRMLTTEMLKQMIDAWMKWPFRPTRYELIARSGSAVHDSDGVEEEIGT